VAGAAMTAPASRSTLTLRYFACVREDMGREREHVVRPEKVRTVGDLLHYLARRDAASRSALERDRLLVAVNQEMVKTGHVLRDGDEVAFFPPVTGG